MQQQTFSLHLCQISSELVYSLALEGLKSHQKHCNFDRIWGSPAHPHWPLMVKFGTLEGTHDVLNHTKFYHDWCILSISMHNHANLENFLYGECPGLLPSVLCLPSVLWRCWLGGRKGIRPVTNFWVVGYWHGYLSGARCRLACGPADATATHSLASVKSRLVLPFWYWLARVVPEKGPLNGCVCACVPGTASTRKVEPVWILLKHETVSGSDISWAICRSAPSSRQITMPAPHHSVFYRLDALPAEQPTASKHWMCSDLAKFLHLL